MGSTLEEAVFRNEKERLRERLHEERGRREARDTITPRCVESEGGLPDRPVSLGIRTDTVEALVVVPLGAVAWADGAIDPRERAAAHRAATSMGVADGSPGYAPLESWTHAKPAPELLESWQICIHEIGCELSANYRWHYEEQVMGKARAVAEPAGGFPGLARVSKSAEAMLATLGAAFRC